ncbi:unnamed protein product [Tilletia caries]|nr:unnamed protein product [Tilletia caries]CAD7065047.1 unnamed protein product [Tilletia caries]
MKVAVLFVAAVAGLAGLATSVVAQVKDIPFCKEIYHPYFTSNQQNQCPKKPIAAAIQCKLCWKKCT